jgi:hypothetical protein
MTALTIAAAGKTNFNFIMIFAPRIASTSRAYNVSETRPVPSRRRKAMIGGPRLPTLDTLSCWATLRRAIAARGEHRLCGVSDRDTPLTFTACR